MRFTQLTLMFTLSFLIISEASFAHHSRYRFATDKVACAEDLGGGFYEYFGFYENGETFDENLQHCHSFPLEALECAKAKTPSVGAYGQRSLNFLYFDENLRECCNSMTGCMEAATLYVDGEPPVEGHLYSEDGQQLRAYYNDSRMFQGLFYLETSNLSRFYLGPIYTRSGTLVREAIR